MNISRDYKNPKKSGLRPASGQDVIKEMRITGEPFKPRDDVLVHQNRSLSLTP